MLFVIRQTYGFGKKDDKISLSQIAKMLGTSRVRCSQIVTTLQEKGVLTVKEFINGLTKKYRFNKDYEEWLTIKKKLNLAPDRIEKPLRTVKENINHKRNTLKKKEYSAPSGPLLPPEEPKQKKKTDTRVKDIIGYFLSQVREQHGIEPLPVDNVDGKLVKLALQKLGDLQAVKNLCHWYIAKGFLKDGNPDTDKYHLRLALSDFQINEFREKGAWQYE